MSEIKLPVRNVNFENFPVRGPQKFEKHWSIV